MGIINALLDGLLAVSNFMWNLPMLIILIGGGLWLTWATDFIQIKHLGICLKTTIGAAFKGKEKGKVSGLQAMTACLANTIGTGNIVGVSSAIAAGGPGAVFWMWVIGFVAMALKACEAIMAVDTRVKDENGNWKGGATRYLSNVWKPLGPIWGFCCIYGMAVGCSAHTGSVTSAASQLGVPTMVTTIIVCIVVALIIIRGLGALISITDKLVPGMAILYVGGGLIVILMNINNLIPAIASIFAGAFTGQAATGGFIGATLSATIRNGCARGVYSSDAGNGGASLLHAQADTDHPVEQGMYGVLEVFLDTIVVCTFTALVVLTTGIWTTGAAGSTLAISAFAENLGGVGRVICAIALMLFAASSIFSMTTSIGLIGSDMFGKVFGRITQGILLLVFLGGTVGVDVMLNYVDALNMIMILVHVIGMLFLTKRLRELTTGYFSK